MATQASAKVERLLNLVICLLHTRRPLLKEQIRRAVPQYDQESDEAFDRMFERDKDELRALGIPLRGRLDPVFEDEMGYHIDRREYALPQIDFTPGEVAALSLAARTWTHASLAGTGAEALRKLAAGGVDTDAASAGPPLGIEPRVRAAEPAFDAVHAAVLAAHPIAFDYRRGSGSSGSGGSGPPGRQRRHVQPWGLASWHGRWYLTGYDTDRDAPRIFRLGRIQGAVTRDGPAGSYEIPADHDPRSTVRFNLDPAGASCSARLRVRAGRAHALRRRASSPAGSSKPTGEVRAWEELRIEYTDEQRFVDELCWYGPDVVVIAPQSVKDAVVRKLRAAAGLAGEGAGPAQGEVAR